MRLAMRVELAELWCSEQGRPIGLGGPPRQMRISRRIVGIEVLQHVFRQAARLLPRPVMAMNMASVAAPRATRFIRVMRRPLLFERQLVVDAVSAFGSPRDAYHLVNLRLTV